MENEKKLECMNCKSKRLAFVSAKTSDGLFFESDEERYDGYNKRQELMIDNDEDYISFEYCLNCGQIQSEFPVK